MAKANWKEAPKDANTWESFLDLFECFCKTHAYFVNGKWHPRCSNENWTILEHRPRIIAWKDMKKGMVVRCAESSGAWYEEGQECLVGLDGHNDFGPLNSRGYISDRPELYTFELVSEPEQRKTVKDAVNDHNFTWPFPRGDKLYFHKTRGKYMCLSKSLDESQGYYFICTREQFEAEVNSTNPYKEQIMDNIQNINWTHEFSGTAHPRKLAVVSNIPDCNGEIAIIKDTPHGLVYSKCKPNQIKPLPEPISKAEAYDWLVSQMYGTGGDVPVPNMNRLWEDLHTQFQVIPEDN